MNKEIKTTDMESKVAPVGTVRRFVSEQFLTDYKTNTLDSAYAPKISATTSRAGIVQLNDAVNSTSTTQAATANAVKKAYDLANGKANASHGNHVPSTQTADARKFLRNDNTWQTLPSATTSATGIVQLSDAVNSTSTTQAATANAVKKAYDLANGKANASHGNHVPTTETANARKFLRNDNTWQTLPSATTSATGIVQLSDAVNSTSTTLAATANAVKKAYDLASNSANINDSTTATNSVWSSSKTQTQINTSYNSMNKKVEALEESMYVEFVSKRGDTVNGDLTIKKSDGTASKLNVHRTLSSNDMQGSLDIYAHNGGSVALSTNNKTSGKQASSYVFGGDAFWSPRNADGVVPDIGTSSYRFNKAWLTDIDATGIINLKGIIYGKNNIALDRGSLWLQGAGGNLTCDYLRFGTNIMASSDNKMIYLIDTAGTRANVDCGDLRAVGLKITNTSYPSLRFSDNVRIEYDVAGDTLYAAGTKSTSSGLREFRATQCNSTVNAIIAGKRVFVQSGTPSGVSTGDVWIQI